MFSPFHLSRLTWPYCVSNAPNKLELLPHIFVSQRITLCVRCESTLWTNAALLESILARLPCAFRNPISGLVDTSDHFVFTLELGEFRGDDTKNDVFVLRKIRKRLEAAGTGGIVFEVICVDVQVLL